MIRKPCPICHKLLVFPTGSEKSEILLVGEQPGYEDVRSGSVYFEGKIGDALRSELMKAGLPIQNCRLTNLWLHAADEKECELKYHIDALIKEFKGRKHILLMGPKVVTALTGKSGNFSGLPVKVLNYTNVMAAPSMATLLAAPIGDWKLSLERFVSKIKF